jgi:hypothetical protein
VATTANSVEAKLLAAYPSLFGNRLLVNASVVLTVDEVRSYAGSNRYETLKKALLGESIVAPSGNAPRSDSGAVYVRTGTPEDVLMTQYPCLFGCARAVVRNATAVGIVVGGRQYTGADRYQTLALALRAEGVL